MGILIAFLTAVAASVVAGIACHYIIQWLDRHFSKN